MVWLRCSRSSGVKPSLRFEIGLKPDMIATYCLPLTSNVIGGALKPGPTLIFHNGSMVAASLATNVPSVEPGEKRAPPGAGAPLWFGDWKSTPLFTSPLEGDAAT